VNNEQYLVLSYFVVGAACALLAIATYALLRLSLAELSRIVPGGKLGLIFRKLFFLGLVLPALAGFFSVTFHSCNYDTYEKIIANRSYLVAKNQEQLSTAMVYLCIALVVWGLIVSVCLVAFSKKSEKND
jgi:hypothetical protein